MMFISFIEIHKCYDVTGEATKSCNWPAVLPFQHDWSGLTVLLRRGARRPECSGRITSRPASLFFISWPRWRPSLPVALTLLCRSNVRPPLGVASGPSRLSLAQVGSGGSSSPDKGRSLSASPPPSRRVGSSQVEIRLPSRCSHWMTCVPTRQYMIYQMIYHLIYEI